MSDLVEFLRARLAEDEATARAATQGDCGGRWWAVESRHYEDGKIRVIKTQAPHDDPDPTYWLGAEWIVQEDDPSAEDEANLRHIARHDPARVLAEVAAKRAIIDDLESLEYSLHQERGTGLFEFSGDYDGLRMLAAVYSDHPDYREEWKP